jgi:hypothetical protein
MSHDTLPQPPDAKLEHLTRAVRGLWAVTLLAGLLACASLAVNVVLVTRLIGLRNGVADTLTSVSRSLDNLSGQGLAFDFPISQTINFEGDVPIKQDVTVPFKSNLPINTVVGIPLDLGPLGKQTINVPVNTTVPIDIKLPVHIEQTIHIRTAVPIRTTIPIRLAPGDAPLKDWIAQAREWLDNIRKRI